MTENSLLAKQVEQLKLRLLYQAQWAFLAAIALALMLVGLELGSPIEQAMWQAAVPGVPASLMQAYFRMPLHSYPLESGIVVLSVLSGYLAIKLFRIRQDAA